MNRFSKEKKDRSLLKDLAMPVLFFILIMSLFWFGLNSISRTTEEQTLNSTRQAIVRSAVNCYAIEGEYPSSLAYMEENYGLTVNHDKYIVNYECFASNIMPTVTVLPKNGGDANQEGTVTLALEGE